jgi:tetratricopeptide (TPR) repeat protein
MGNFLEYLSGGVPGGLVLFFAVLLTANLALFFLYRSSKLFNLSEYRSHTVRTNVMLFGTYLILWLLLRPATLPDRVMFLPWQQSDSLNFTAAELLQNDFAAVAGDEYLVHCWEQFLHSADPDSLPLYEYRIRLARRIGADMIVEGQVLPEAAGYKLVIHETEAHEFGVPGQIENAYPKILSSLLNQAGLRNSTPNQLSADAELNKLVMVKRMLAEGKEVPQQLLDESFAGQFPLTFSAALLYRAIPAVAELSENPLDGTQTNPDFIRIRKALLPLGKEGNDTAESNLLLGRMFLYENQYGSAEVFLKKALIQDRFNSRIYFNLSFLHRDRFRELGFEDRAAVLEQALKLDPGYLDAACELAEEYFSGGTPMSGVQKSVRAKETIANAYRINPRHVRVMEIMAGLEVKTKETDKAIAIYRQLIARFPQVSQHYYNLGICYFHLEDYDAAEVQFKKAVALDDHLDAHLYLGGIYKIRGDFDAALTEFRYRIRHKTGDDDKYAREAMRGVRLILDDIAAQESADSLKAVTNQ